MNKPFVVAAFDFDGTLTYCDSLPFFILHLKGFIPTLTGFLQELPTFFGYICGKLSRQAVKEKILSRFLKGYSLAELNSEGERFAQKKLARLMRSTSIPCVRWHLKQGHRCILVSANLDVYLVPWAKMLGFQDVICSNLAYSDEGSATGQLQGKNCWGGEKPRRLSERLGPRENYTLYVYGDSKGDEELFKMANFAFYKSLNYKMVKE
jgi:phosphatidylglycerophosphatase C